MRAHGVHIGRKRVVVRTVGQEITRLASRHPLRTCRKTNTRHDSSKWMSVDFPDALGTRSTGKSFDQDKGEMLNPCICTEYHHTIECRISAKIVGTPWKGPSVLN